MSAPISPLTIPEQNLDWKNPDFWPDVNTLVTEDGAPVDNPFAEKQMRALTEPLDSSWPGPGGGRAFRVLANVGLYNSQGPAIVPDVMLGLDVRSPNDLLVKGHRAWFVWIVGRKPDAAIEIVSNLVGGEDTEKLIEYAVIGVPYYIIYDPLDRLKKGVLRGFALREGRYESMGPRWMPNLGLGLVLWQGKYEDVEATWLRWCDQDGIVIPTGAERAAAAEQRVEQAEQRVEQAEQRAEQAKQRAVQEQQARAAAENRARAAEEMAQRLAEQLRRSSGEPPA